MRTSLIASRHFGAVTELGKEDDHIVAMVGSFVKVFARGTPREA
ncbi:hypothetical protein ACWGVR_20395 [Streptomyces xanthophaeus]